MRILELEEELYAIITWLEHLHAGMASEGLDVQNIAEALDSLYWAQRDFGK